MIAVLESDEMADERTDRERLLSLEATVDGLRAVLAEQRNADREVLNQAIKQLSGQVVQLASSSDRYAHTTALEKLEVKVLANEKTLNDLKETTIPRAEVQLRLDGVAARQETMATGIQKLDASLVRLSDEWNSQETNSRLAEESSYKKRNAVIAMVAVITSVIGLSASIYFNSHKPKLEIIYPSAVTTTTTTVRP